MSERLTLAFIPGLLNDGALFAHQLEHLAELADCRLVDVASDDTLAGMAERALAHLEGRFAPVGLSMGGYVAFELWRRAPERIGGLALLDTQAAPDTEARRAERRKLMALTEAGSFEGALEQELAKLFHPERLADAKWRALGLDMARRVGAQAYVRQHRACMSRSDSRPDLPGISVPTLVLCGREDNATPVALHEEMAAAIPGAALHIVERCGHLASVERPEEVTARLREWLTGL